MMTNDYSSVHQKLSVRRLGTANIWPTRFVLLWAHTSTVNFTLMEYPLI